MIQINLDPDRSDLGNLVQFSLGWFTKTGLSEWGLISVRVDRPENVYETTVVMVQQSQYALLQGGYN